MRQARHSTHRLADSSAGGRCHRHEQSRSGSWHLPETNLGLQPFQKHAIIFSRLDGTPLRWRGRRPDENRPAESLFHRRQLFAISADRETKVRTEIVGYSAQLPFWVGLQPNLMVEVVPVLIAGFE